MVNRSRISPYSQLHFYSIRAFAFISSSIVSIIVGWFWYQLKHDDFKIPWSFLLIILASSLTGVSLICTTAIHSWAFLSPLFNLVLNVTLSIIWITGSGVLTWDTVGALSHSCSISNWGNSDGVMICQRFQANYAFIIIGVLSSVAMVVVDVRARIKQNALRRYMAMSDSQLRLMEERRQKDDSTWSATYSSDKEAGFYDEDGEVPYGIDPDVLRPRNGSR